jgi:hypothetical protein
MPDASLAMGTMMWRASVEDRQIELAQALGIGQKVNLDDPPSSDGERPRLAREASRAGRRRSSACS